jgi:hypothetical protein
MTTNRNIIIRMFTVFIGCLFIYLILGCSNSPDDKALETVITDKILSVHLPPAFVNKNMLGGYATEVSEIEILEKSHEKEELNGFQKMLGAKAREYWSVAIRVKGTSQIGSTRDMFSNNPESKQSFHLKTKVKVYERENGSYEVDIPLIF